MTKQDKKLFEHMFRVISAASKSNLEALNAYKTDYEVVFGVDGGGAFRFHTICRSAGTVTEFFYNDDFQRLAWASEVSQERQPLRPRPTSWPWHQVEWWGTYEEFVDAFSKEHNKKSLFESCK